MNVVLPFDTPVFVNSSLTIRGHYGNRVEGLMIRQLWEALLAAEAFAERKLLQRSRERWMEEHLADQEQCEKKELQHEELSELLIISESLRQTFEQLSHAIDDAIWVARRAYNRAVEDEESARKALEDTQGKAIVLPDGRRVYFGRDGHLYGEDRQEITNADAIDEARRRVGGEDAPSFESYLEVRKRHDQADELVQHLSHILEELDGLKQLQTTGAVSPEEIQHRRETLTRIVESLPPSARADFEALQKERLERCDPAYVGTGLTPATDAETSKAASSFLKQDIEAEADATATRKPAYTNIPNF
jgi:hypothetical protein